MPETSQPPEDARKYEVGYETSDLSPKYIVVVLGSLSVLMFIGVLVAAAVFLIWWRTSTSIDTSVAPQPDALPPGPRLQARPWEELAAFQREEELLLNSYDWMDKESGRIRIPIDRAIALLAERGLPVLSETPETAPPTLDSASLEGNRNEQ